MGEGGGVVGGHVGQESVMLLILRLEWFIPVGKTSIGIASWLTVQIVSEVGMYKVLIKLVKFNKTYKANKTYYLKSFWNLKWLRILLFKIQSFLIGLNCSIWGILLVYADRLSNAFHIWMKDYPPLMTAEGKSQHSFVKVQGRDNSAILLLLLNRKLIHRPNMDWRITLSGIHRALWW